MKTKLITARQPGALNRFMLLFAYLAIILAMQVHKLNAQNNSRDYIIPVQEGLGVNALTGSCIYRRSDISMECRGPMDLNIGFNYNSSYTAIDNGFGPGWFMSYTMKCKRLSSTIIQVRRNTGQTDTFNLISSNYVGPAGVFDSLSEYSTGKYKLIDKKGVQYFFDDSTHNSLTKIKDRNNNEISINYSSGLPISITDPSGRLISFTYAGGHLTQITDANISPNRIISITYNASYNPITVIDVLGYQLKYEYDSRYNLTKFTNEDNVVFNITYADCIHVSDISIPGVNQRTFTQNDLTKTTTMNMQVGSNLQSTSYKFDVTGNLIETIGNCCGYHTNYMYDANRNVTQKTDAMGYNTNYSYNARGDMLEETDTYGDKIVMTYNNYSDVISIKDKKNNTTSYTYNSQGNLTSVNKPMGVTESYTYNSNGEINSHTDARGFTTNYVRNGNGDITQIDFPGGISNSFTVNNVGYVTSKVDGNGNSTIYTFNKKGWITQIQEPLNTNTTKVYNGRGLETSTSNALGQTTNFTYNALGVVTAEMTPTGTISTGRDQAGNAISITDKKGNTTNRNFNALNQLISEVNPMGQTHTITYNPSGNIVTEKGFNGVTTTYLYDSLNRVKGILDPMSSLGTGDYTKIEYDKNGNKSKVTDPLGNITSYTYNALNRLTSEQKPIGTNTMSYDAAGNLTTMINALGNSTTYAYDNRNRLTVETDPLLHSSIISYDDNNNVVAITNKNGHTQTFGFNPLNQKVAETNALGETTTFVANKLGYIISTFLPNGRVITNTYDAGNRITSSSDNLGTLFTKTYDANDNVLVETDGNGLNTGYTYNAINQVVTVTDPQMNTIINTYNSNSYLVSRTDRNGSTTSYSYDSLGRVISTLLPNGDLISQTYDRNGNITSRKDDNNNVTTYTYDGNGRMTTEIFANGTSNFYGYDLAGRNITKTNQKGLTTSYAYDNAGRLLIKNYPGTIDDNYTYDNEGKMLSANNINTTLYFTYDNDGKLLSENNNGKITSYQYQITPTSFYRQVTYPGGRVIKENYNLRNNLQEIKEGATTLITKSYDNGQRLTGMSFNNGTVAAYTYTLNNSIASITHTKVSPLTTIAQFNYIRDNEANILTAQKVHRPTNSEKYIYNTNQQLVNFKEGTLISGNIAAPLTQSQFNYDGVQNRTSMVKDGITTNYTNNNMNQYTTINSGSAISPTYDLNGNMLTDGTLNYSYDDKDQLFTINGGTLATYFYDALGRRNKKIAGGTTVLYYYDGRNVIEERNASNAVQATCIFGKGDDEILSMKRGTNTYFYHTNALGSVIAVSGTGGSVVERYEYTAFGKPSFFTGSYGILSISAIGNPYLFTAREYDAESGNYYYRARYYSPNIGRFLQTDPIGVWGDPINIGNVYSYVGNNPINLTDFLGLRACIKKSKTINKSWGGVAKKNLIIYFEYEICKSDISCPSGMGYKIEEFISGSIKATMGYQAKFKIPIVNISGEASVKGSAAIKMTASRTTFCGIVNPEIPIVVNGSIGVIGLLDLQITKRSSAGVKIAGEVAMELQATLNTSSMDFTFNSNKFNASLKGDYWVKIWGKTWSGNLFNKTWQW